MATITKLDDGKYRVRVSKGTGSRRQVISRTIRGPLKAAKEWARQYETLIDTGQIPSQRLTFEQIFELWIKTIAASVQPRTLDGYESYIKRYALQHFGPRLIADIETIHIQSLYAGLTLSPTTIRNLNAALRAMFNWAIKRNALTRNPCTGVDLPAKHHREIITLTPAEAAAFTAACRSMANGIIFEFALETGMRPEEYLALRWSDITGTDVTVRQAVQFNRSGGGFYFKQLKTKRSRRRIPLSASLVAHIAEHRRQQLEMRLASRVTWADLDLVFPNAAGRPISLPNLTRRYLRPIIEAAGIRKHITLYSLRHSCATLLLMARENPKTVADRLGHASVVLTLDTYSHVMPHIQDAATNILAKIMHG